MLEFPLNQLGEFFTLVYMCFMVYIVFLCILSPTVFCKCPVCIVV
jgi:hypothetical protein